MAGFRGVRLPAYLVAMLACGLLLGTPYAQLVTGLADHTVSQAPIQRIPMICLVILGLAQAVWWGSWPRTDPVYGRYRWMVWPFLCVTSMIAVLLALILVH